MRTLWKTNISSRVMLLPDGEGTRPVVEGDGVLGLLRLPNILVSLPPVLPLACLLKLSTCTAVMHDQHNIKQEKLFERGTPVIIQTWKLLWCPAKASRCGV